MNNHKVFICYDQAEDGQFARELALFCDRAGIAVCGEPEEATVSIVLVGPKTWARSAVDRQIEASLSNGGRRPNGLIGVLLELVA